jgi:hypothetical protein
MTTAMNGFKRFATAWLFALATVALLLGAAYAAWIWIEHDRSMAELRDRGVATTGTVIAATMAAGENPAKYEMQRPARYYITYRFVDAGGTPHEGMTNGTGLYYSQLGAGDEFAIRYLPDNPSVSIYDRSGSMLSSTPINLIGVMLGMAVLCGFLAVAGWRKAIAPPKSVT